LKQSAGVPLRGLAGVCRHRQVTGAGQVVFGRVIAWQNTVL
jgi:hypothetical protein